MSVTNTPKRTRRSH